MIIYNPLVPRPPQGSGAYTGMCAKTVLDFAKTQGMTEKDAHRHMWKMQVTPGLRALFKFRQQGREIPRALLWAHLGCSEITEELEVWFSRYEMVVLSDFNVVHRCDKHEGHPMRGKIRYDKEGQPYFAAENGGSYRGTHEWFAYNAFRTEKGEVPWVSLTVDDERLPKQVTLYGVTAVHTDLIEQQLAEMIQRRIELGIVEDNT